MSETETPVAFGALRLAPGEVCDLDDAAALLARVEGLADAAGAASDLGAFGDWGPILLDLGRVCGGLVRFLRDEQPFAWEAETEPREAALELVELARGVLEAHAREPELVSVASDVERAAAALLHEAALTLDAEAGGDDGPDDDEPDAQALEAA